MNPIYLSTPKRSLEADHRYHHREPVQKFRSDFAKDRDRILYSKAFRRLSGKTQIFISSSDRDIRTRLTHTLEVNQIAQTIAIALASNLELTEAIALGHDIGHTPFGHVGERTLNFIMNNCERIRDIEIEDQGKGFKHNLQALRIACDLERPIQQGLNLSKYTLWGIANHSKLTHRNCDITDEGTCYNTHKPKRGCENRTTKCSFYNTYLDGINHDNYWSIEGYIVAIADEIAQRHHDIEDSLRNDIVGRRKLLEQLEMFRRTFDREDKKNFKDLCYNAEYKSLEEFLMLFSRFIVNFYVKAVITHTKDNIKRLGDRYNIRKSSDFTAVKSDISMDDAKNIVGYSPDIRGMDENFQEFLKSNILSSYLAQTMDGKGEFIIRRLFKAYVSNPKQLPDSVIDQFYSEIHDHDHNRIDRRGSLLSCMEGYENELMRVVSDYIGGMTDQYAYHQYDLLYGTKV